jgi:hypothetical protein
VSIEDNYGEKIKYFVEKYPLEQGVVWMTAMKFNEIYNDVSSSPGFQGSRNAEVKFNVTKASGRSKKIRMTDEGVFLLGALGGAITKNILSHLGSEYFEVRVKQIAEEAAKQYVKQEFLIENPKKCTKCNMDNDYKNKFCTDCGEKLPES